MTDYTEKDHEIDCLVDTVHDLTEENQKLRDALATNTLPDIEVNSARETIINLRRELKTMEIELTAVKRSRDLLQSESYKKERLIQWYKRRMGNAGSA